MSSLLIKNADAIVTCDSQDAVLEHANLLMQDGIITYIGIEPQTADEVIDGTGCLVSYPGLINTHHHLYQTLQPKSSASSEHGIVRLAYNIVRDLEKSESGYDLPQLLNRNG